jgi:hypothetical protein
LFFRPCLHHSWPPRSSKSSAVSRQLTVHLCRKLYLHQSLRIQRGSLIISYINFHTINFHCFLQYSFPVPYNIE